MAPYPCPGATAVCPGGRQPPPPLLPPATTTLRHTTPHHTTTHHTTQGTEHRNIVGGGGGVFQIGSGGRRQLCGVAMGPCSVDVGTEGPRAPTLPTLPSVFCFLAADIIVFLAKGFTGKTATVNGVNRLFFVPYTDEKVQKMSNE